MNAPAKDLVVLVSDKDMETAVKALLVRTEALCIRQIRFDVYKHPDHDPGCLSRAHTFLQSFQRQYGYAIVIFDHEGSGHEHRSRQDVQSEVALNLASCGWEGRCAAIVISPELEAWVWSDSPHVDAALGWGSPNPDLRTWMKASGWLPTAGCKPDRPKEAMEQCLRKTRKPRSSAIFGEIAKSVSFKRCADPAFCEFQQVLRRWFGLPPK